MPGIGTLTLALALAPALAIVLILLIRRPRAAEALNLAASADLAPRHSHDPGLEE